MKAELREVGIRIFCTVNNPIKNTLLIRVKTGGGINDAIMLVKAVGAECFFYYYCLPGWLFHFQIPQLKILIDLKKGYLSWFRGGTLAKNLTVKQ